MRMELLVLQNQQNPLSQNHKNLLLSLSMLLLLALLHPLLDPLELVMGKQLEMVGPLPPPFYSCSVLDGGSAAAGSKAGSTGAPVLATYVGATGATGATGSIGCRISNYCVWR